MKKNVTKTKEYKEKVEKTMYFMRIAEVIFKARNEKKISQKELAKRAETTQRIISNIENADDYNIGADLLYRILKSLGKEMVIDRKDVITGKDCLILNIAENQSVPTIKSSAQNQSDAWNNESEKLEEFDKFIFSYTIN